jgi:5-bromo-4-chloroindolyl phosphate hydrolysis protein
MKGEIRQLIFGLLGGLATFGLGLVINMPVLLTVVLSIASYYGAYMLSKPQIKIGRITLSEANGEDMKKLMQDGAEDIRALKAGRSLSNESISRLSGNLYEKAVSIYEHLQENPDKIQVARRFLTYYLDTASGLVEKYGKLKRTRLQSRSIDKVEAEVTDGLEILSKAFDKEFEHLLEGEIMDIETDVKVLEQTFGKVE